MSRFIQVAHTSTMNLAFGADGPVIKARLMIAFPSGTKGKTSVFSFLARILSSGVMPMSLERADIRPGLMMRLILFAFTKKPVVNSWRNSMAGSAGYYSIYGSGDSFFLTIVTE